MKDFVIFFLVIYIFCTSFLAARYLSSPSPAATSTPLKQLVLPSYKSKIILNSGEEIIASNLLSTDTHFTITSESGLELTVPVANVKRVVSTPSEQVDRRLFAFGTITQQSVSTFEDILLFSDTLFLLWFVGIIWLSRKKKLPFWQGWLIASLFCLGQSFLTASIIGRTSGAFFLAIPNISTAINHFIPQVNDTVFWCTQIFLVGVVPTSFFVVLSRYQMRKKLSKLESTLCASSEC